MDPHSQFHAGGDGSAPVDSATPRVLSGTFLVGAVGGRRTAARAGARSPLDSQLVSELLVEIGRGSVEAFSALVGTTQAWATAHAYAVVRDRS